MRGQLTFDAEGQEGGRWHSRVLHVPSDSSGLTIGRGYDMKEKTALTIKKDLMAAGVVQSVAVQLSEAAGLKGDAARAMIVGDLATYELSKAGQVALFNIVYTRLEKDVVRICSKADVVKKYGATDWTGLDSRIREVLIDLRFRGDYHPRSRRLIQAAVAANDFEDFKAKLVHKASWKQVPNDRFRRRSEYLNKAVPEAVQDEVKTLAASADTKEEQVTTGGKVQLFDIIKNVGAGLISTLVPGAGALISTVNAILPDSMKLPDNATGNQVKAAIDSLSPEARAELLNKEFEVDIVQIKESNDTVRTMLTADASMKHSTRPYIAKGSFQVIAVVTLVVIALWAYGVGSGNTEVVKVVVEGWPFILAVTAPLVVLLKAYFGVLEREHKTKLDAANGVSQPAGVASILSSVLGRK